MASLQSEQELVANLAEYQGQLQQVEKLLLGDPENAELTDMYNSLAEVIQLTEDLLKEAQQGQQDASTSAADQAGPSSSSGAEQHQQQAPGTSAGLSSDLNLPASVADQIKKAQVRAALLGQADATWAIGAKCQAQYSADGQFYVATVEGVSETGNFVVVFDGYGDKEEVAKSSVRPIEEEEAGYTGVAAPKRKRVEEEPTITEIPKWLQIKDTDDEKTKERKKKLLKSYKSKIRFQNMDLKQKEKQDNWQSFIKGKGSKKKTGFLTGTKKESMFKVPEGLGSKVGVIGSGKGMTDFHKKARHEYELDE